MLFLQYAVMTQNFGAGSLFDDLVDRTKPSRDPGLAPSGMYHGDLGKSVTELGKASTKLPRLSSQPALCDGSALQAFDCQTGGVDRTCFASFVCLAVSPYA
jgi:hypothetical protein